MSPVHSSVCLEWFLHLIQKYMKCLRAVWVFGVEMRIVTRSTVHILSHVFALFPYIHTYTFTAHSRAHTHAHIRKHNFTRFPSSAASCTDPAVNSADESKKMLADFIVCEE